MRLLEAIAILDSYKEQGKLDPNLPFYEKEQIQTLVEALNRMHEEVKALKQ